MNNINTGTPVELDTADKAATTPEGETNVVEKKEAEPVLSSGEKTFNIIDKSFEKHPDEKAAFLHLDEKDVPYYLFTIIPQDSRGAEMMVVSPKGTFTLKFEDHPKFVQNSKKAYLLINGDLSSVEEIFNSKEPKIDITKYIDAHHVLRNSELVEVNRYDPDSMTDAQAVESSIKVIDFISKQVEDYRERPEEYPKRKRDSLFHEELKELSGNITRILTE